MGDASSSTDKPTFRADGNVAIHVPDLARAEAFYGGVLGFRLLSRASDKLVFDAGALRLYVNLDPATVRPFIPALEVADHEHARRHLLRSGCRIVHEWPGGKARCFEDPFGTVLDVIERRPAAASPSRPK